MASYEGLLFMRKLPHVFLGGVSVTFKGPNKSHVRGRRKPGVGKLFLHSCILIYVTKEEILLGLIKVHTAFLVPHH